MWRTELLGVTGRLVERSYYLLFTLICLSGFTTTQTTVVYVSSVIYKICIFDCHKKTIFLCKKQSSFYELMYEFIHSVKFILNKFWLADMVM